MKEFWIRLKKVLSDPRYLLWKWQTKVGRELRFVLKRSRKSAGTTEAPRSVVMIHIGRSGSTALGDLMDQHPDIFWDGEVWRDMVAAGLDQPISGNDFHSFLEKRKRVAGGLIYGYEVKFFHIGSLADSLEGQLEVLERLGPTEFIVLERKNYLRKVISSVKASRTTRWHQPAGSVAALEKLAISPDKLRIDGKDTALLPLLRAYEEDFQNLRQCLTGRKHLWLTYEEDLAESPLRGYQKIADFLGIEPVPVKVQYGKTNPYPVKDVIENYEEVVASLEGTGFEWMARE